MKSMPSLSLLTVLGPILALGAAFIVATSGCTLPTECDTQGVPPVNVTATAGNGTATLTWEIPVYDTLELDAVQTMVLYPAQGGAGEQCAGAHVNHTPEGCVRGCESTSGTRCTVTGLQSGVSYTFTVVTTAYPRNLYDCAVEAFVRTDPLAIGAP